MTGIPSEISYIRLGSGEIIKADKIIIINSHSEPIKYLIGNIFYFKAREPTYEVEYYNGEEDFITTVETRSIEFLYEPYSESKIESNYLGDKAIIGPNKTIIDLHMITLYNFQTTKGPPDYYIRPLHYIQYFNSEGLITKTTTRFYEVSKNENNS